MKNIDNELNTTIQINKNTRKRLKKLKKYPKETYNDLLMRWIEDKEKGQ